MQATTSNVAMIKYTEMQKRAAEIKQFDRANNIILTIMSKKWMDMAVCPAQ